MTIPMRVYADIASKYGDVDANDPNAVNGFFESGVYSLSEKTRDEITDVLIESASGASSVDVIPEILDEKIPFPNPDDYQRADGASMAGSVERRDDSRRRHQARLRAQSLKRRESREYRRKRDQSHRTFGSMNSLARRKVLSTLSISTGLTAEQITTVVDAVDALKESGPRARVPATAGVRVWQAGELKFSKVITASTRKTGRVVSGNKPDRQARRGSNPLIDKPVD